MSKVVAIITSRYNSKRLPGKALLKIKEKPIIQWIYDRVSPVVSDVVVCTTDNSQPIIDYCQVNSIPVFISNNNFVEEENLIHRVIQCGDKYDADIVVRLWGDCPFIDTEQIDNKIVHFMESDVDYLHPVNFIKGINFTIYRHSSFVKLFHLMSEGDKWYWNYVDEVTGWQKYGFKVELDDYRYNLKELRGLNINTKADLEDACNAVDTYGLNIRYTDLIEMYGGK